MTGYNALWTVMAILWMLGGLIGLIYAPNPSLTVEMGLVSAVLCGVGIVLFFLGR